MAYIDSKARKFINESPIGNVDIRSADELSYALLVVTNSALLGGVSLTAVLGAFERSKNIIINSKVNNRDAQAKFDNGDIE